MRPKPLHGFGILFASDSLRFLRCNVSVFEPTQQVSQVELNVPLASDDLGHAATGPEVGCEPEGLGTLSEPSQDLAFLSLGEFAGPWWGRLSFEAFIAMEAVIRLPDVDGSFADAEEVGDFGNGVSVVESLDSE